MLLDHTSGLDDFFLHPRSTPRSRRAGRRTGRVARTLKYVGEAVLPRRARAGTTRTRTTSPRADRRARDRRAARRRRSATRFFGPLGLDARGTRRRRSRAPDPPTATASPARSGPRRPIDLSDGHGVAPFRSVVTAAGAARARSRRRAATRRRGPGAVLAAGPRPGDDRRDAARLRQTAAYQPRVPYGHGVQAFPIDGQPTIGHSGTLLGFRAAMRHLPGEAIDDLRPDQPEPGRPRRDRPGPALGRVRARAALLPLPDASAS